MLGALIFLVLTFLCGITWTRLLCPWARRFEYSLPTGFVFGFTWFSLFSVLAYAGGWTFQTFLLIYGVSSTAFLLSFQWKGLWSKSVPLLSGWGAIVAALLCITVIVLSTRLGGFMAGDGAFHQARIQHLLACDSFDNTGPYLRDLKDIRYSFGTWHAFLATALSCMQRAYEWVPWVWFYLPLLMGPMVVFAQYSFGATLFNRSGAGVIAAAIWVIHYFVLAYTDTKHFSDGQTLHYPSGLCAHLLIPVGLTIYLRSCEKAPPSGVGGGTQEKEWKPWAAGLLVGLVVLATTWVHAFYGLLLLAALVLLCVAVGLHIWDRAEWIRRWGVPVAVALGVSLPWFAYLAATMPPVRNPFFLNPTGWPSKFKILSDTAFILDPKLTFGSLGHYQEDRIVTLAILLGFIALVGAWRARWAAYVGLSTVVVVAMVSIPVVVSGLASILTAYKIPRLTLLIPTSITITGCLLILYDLWRAKRSRSLHAAIVGIGLLLLLWVYQDAWTRLGYLGKWCETRTEFDALINKPMRDARDLFAREEKRPTILGNDVRTYQLGAYYPVWAVSLPAAHAAPAFDFRSRDNVCRFLKGDLCTLYDVQRLALDYEADYLVLKRDKPIVSQLSAAFIEPMGSSGIYRLPLPASVFEENGLPNPYAWTEREQWIAIGCPDEEELSSWGPGNTVEEMAVPTGLGERFFARIMKSDGLDRGLAYKPLIPVNGEGRPRYISFWFYLESVEGVCLDRVSTTWHGGSYVWTRQQLADLKLSERLHDGWNALLLEIPARAMQHTREPSGLRIGLLYAATDPPKYIACGIRGITAYIKPGS